MAKCRNCGTQVEPNEKYCPVCGIASPVRIKKQQTVDLTTMIDPVAADYELYDAKSRKVAFLYFLTLGFTGAGFFYLRKVGRGVVWVNVNVLSITLLTVLGASKQIGIPWWGLFLIVFGLFFLINLGLGLYYLFAPDVKDGVGEFLE